MFETVAYISVSEDDRLAIEAASIGLPFPIDFFERDFGDNFVPDQEPIQLVVHGVSGATVTEQLEDAERMYRSIRRAAGLPGWRPARVMVGPREAQFDGRHFTLFDLAWKLIDDGQPEFAVVAAQTACELYTELAVNKLLRARDLGDLGEAVGSMLPRTFSLDNDRHHRIFRALTNKSPRGQDWWKAYAAHVERRNGIVHAGKRVTEADARASLDAARHLMNFVAEAWNDSL